MAALIKGLTAAEKLGLALGVPGAVAGILAAVNEGKRFHGGRRRKGSSLVHIANIPLESRPALYSIGGAMRKRRPTRGRGVTPAPHYVHPHLSHTKYGDPIHVRGHWAAGARKRRGGAAPLYTTAIRNVPFLNMLQEPLEGIERDIRAAVAGRGLLRPAGRGRASPAPHYVRPHLSHTKYGEPISVRGHWASGARRRMRR